MTPFQRVALAELARGPRTTERLAAAHLGRPTRSPSAYTRSLVALSRTGLIARRGAGEWWEITAAGLAAVPIVPRVKPPLHQLPTPVYDRPWKRGVPAESPTDTTPPRPRGMPQESPMRSIHFAAVLAVLALAVAGCGGSHQARPALDPSVALAGDDFRNGKVVSATGTLAGEPDQIIQVEGAAVRFHVTSLGVDVAGYNGQEFTIGGNVYRLLVGKDSPTSLPNGVVGLQGSAGSVTWNATPIGAGG